MKAVAFIALLLACSLPSLARAGTLVTGVVRDQDGAAVVSARVRAYGTGGQVTGEGRAGTDGTFALDAASAPVQLEVQCRYCVTTRVAIRADESAIVLVRRYAALSDAGLSAADLASLPYRRVRDLASVLPYTLAGGSELSDRGLNGGRGAIVLDGVPLYRTTDGTSASDAIAPFTIAQLQALSPLAALTYGTYAQGGTFDLQTSGAPVARIDTGDAFDVVLSAGTPALGAQVASAHDDDGTRNNASIAAEVPFAGGIVHARALALADSAQSLVGGSLGYTTASRRAIVTSSIAARSSADASFVGGAASVRSRARFPLEFGARASRSSGKIFDGTAGSAASQAVFLALESPGAHTARVSFAYERDGEALRSESTTIAGTIVAIGDEVALGERFVLHVGMLGDLRAPTLGEVRLGGVGERSAFVESALSYTDNARVRLRTIVYHERIARAGTPQLAGFGLDGAWQIAPALVLRGWTLERALHADARGSYPTTLATTPSDAHQRALWLTAGTAVRLDLLVRDGPLEGDIRVPFGAYSATLGTAIRSGVRVTTVGVGARPAL